MFIYHFTLRALYVWAPYIIIKHLTHGHFQAVWCSTQDMSSPSVISQNYDTMIEMKISIKFNYRFNLNIVLTRPRNEMGSYSIAFNSNNTILLNENPVTLSSSVLLMSPVASHITVHRRDSLPFHNVLIPYSPFLSIRNPTTVWQFLLPCENIEEQLGKSMWPWSMSETVLFKVVSVLSVNTCIYLKIIWHFFHPHCFNYLVLLYNPLPHVLPVINAWEVRNTIVWPYHLSPVLSFFAKIAN